jgi:hypothetical protein
MRPVTFAANRKVLSKRLSCNCKTRRPYDGTGRTNVRRRMGPRMAIRPAAGGGGDCLHEARSGRSTRLSSPIGSFRRFAPRAHSRAISTRTSLRRFQGSVQGGS